MIAIVIATKTAMTIATAAIVAKATANSLA
jgi:hypothetical protein